MNKVRKRASERLLAAKKEAVETVQGIRSGILPSFSRGDKVCAAGTIMLTSFAYATETSFAAVSIFDSVKKMITDNFTPFITMTCCLAVALLAVATLVWFVFPSDRGAETGKKWFVRIVLCLVLLLSLGAIFGAISQFTEGMHADIGTISIN